MEQLAENEEWTELNWLEGVLGDKNAESMWNISKATLNDIACKYTPRKLRKQINERLWWNQKVDQAIKGKNRAGTIYKQSDNDHDYVHYRKTIDIATMLEKWGLLSISLKGN